ncbi:MAG: hypothetical protein KatS3mg096_335 [Candidatus Parcubacteria bacterium]|nr:MAG: hypothetical protein KatS3mg096_335 [Candidatus Parcubacteria bacterium]
MRRRKKEFPYKIILSLLFVFIIFYFVLFFEFKEIVIEPESFENYLRPYWQNHSPYEIISSLKKIMIDFPEIKKIEIRSNIFEQKLFLNIKSSQIIAQICDKDKCFYLDNYAEIIIPGELRNIRRATSKILITNNQYQNVARHYLLIYSHLPIENNTLLNPEIKNLLSLLFEYANWKPLILTEIKIYSNFDIGVIDSQNREFLFDPAKDIEEQIKKLHIFLTKNFPGTRIDLRISKKIYFK